MPVNLLNIAKITPATSPLVVDGSLNLTGTGVQYLVNGAALITGIGVQHGAALVGTQPAINLVDTASAVWTITNNGGQNRVDVSLAATGSGYLPDPTTTLGDLIVRSTTAVNRLPVGTNGQMLVADSTVATLGVAWKTITADMIDLNPAGVTWTTVQDAVEGLSTLDVLTTKGDILGFATTPARVAVGTNNQALLADSTTASGLAWKTLTADIVNLTSAIGTWNTVQDAISGIDSALTVLTRGLTYVGYYDAAIDDAEFVPAMSSLSGSLPAANAAGIEEGDYLVVTSATAGPPALNVGDQLISGGPSGSATWIILPIGHNLATVTAATVPLAPVIGAWNTVQDAVTGLNTRAQAAGAANQIQFNGGGTPPAFAASANLSWDGSDLFVGPADGTGTFIGANNINSSDHLDLWAQNAIAVGCNSFTVATSSGAGGVITLNAVGAAGAIILLTNATERMRLTPGGNVGIGNNNPQYALDIVGDLNITGDFSINDIVFAEAGSVNMKATSITGIDGEPLLVTGDVTFEVNGRSVTLDQLLDRLEVLEHCFGAL